MLVHGDVIVSPDPALVRCDDDVDLGRSRMVDRAASSILLSSSSSPVSGWTGVLMSTLSRTRLPSRSRLSIVSILAGITHPSLLSLELYSFATRPGLFEERVQFRNTTTSYLRIR